MREIECCFGGGSDPGAASVLIPCEGESQGKNTGDDRGRLAKKQPLRPSLDLQQKRDDRKSLSRK